MGLGTFMVAPEVTAQAVYTALKNGYRLIDTANAYLNEKAVGEGSKEPMRKVSAAGRTCFFPPNCGPLCTIAPLR